MCLEIDVSAGRIANIMAKGRRFPEVAVNNTTCPSCGSPMKRNGKTKSGSQRWRCVGCGVSVTHLDWRHLLGRLGVRTLIQFLSRIILGGFLETAPRWLPARLDLAVIGCRIRPCRYNLPVGLGDVRMRPMLVANRLGMARCGCRNDRFCHAAKPAGSGR